MNNPTLVAVHQREQDLVGDLLDQREVQRCVRLDLLLEVGIFEVEYHLEFTLVELVVVDLEDVGEVQVLQNGEFADGCGGNTFILRIHFDLFDGHFLVCLFLGREEHIPLCAFSQLLIVGVNH